MKDKFGYFLKTIWRVIWCKKEEYEPFDDEYLESFGIKNGKPTDQKKIEKAYTKAWENRDFEINKFWTRALYFWGFISVIFVGYLEVLTSKEFSKMQELHIDLYLLILGLLFSQIWYLSMLGSKAWYENWEKHIRMLEKYVSGDLIKIVFYKSNIYSVSKLSEISAIIVMIFWAALLIQYFCGKSICIGLATILFYAICTIILRYGYPSGSYKSKKKNTFIRTREKYGY
ncbi:MAG: hypothetical protein LBG21_00290 [Campylobacteraceae bacterium]|jgi:hypothetical protein|nr:hypothetical protein [Campylobacteraceae bacterium]